MSYQVTDALLEFYKRMGQLQTGRATGGSETEILDTAKNGTGRDNSWKNGAAIIIETTDNQAPEGEFGRISASAAATFGLTFATALTAAVGAGDAYGFVGSEYPLFDMIEHLNSALLKCGYIDLVDITTLTSVSSQSEYAASADWKLPYGPTRVDCAGRDDSDDYGWVEQVDFDWEPAAAGAGGKIIIPSFPVYTGMPLRVWYRGPHARVSAYSDVIDGRIDPEVLTQNLISVALDWNNTRIRGGDKYLIKRQNKAEQDLINVEADSPKVVAPVRSKLLVLGKAGRHYPGDRNPT
jgi:hypothetical protein